MSRVLYDLKHFLSRQSRSFSEMNCRRALPVCKKKRIKKMRQMYEQGTL